MSVPLDRLYHYLADCVNHDLVIYRWAPHGSRKLEDLVPIGNYSKLKFSTHPMMICHDQEPLMCDFYSKDQIKAAAKNTWSIAGLDGLLCNSILDYHADQYLRGAVACANHYDLTMLLHSEQRSSALTWFSQNGFVPVYCWGHALIAHDWFRYANHDPKLNFNLHKIKQDFLVYNRAWSGTREYRLYFTQKIVDQQLIDHVKTTFNPNDPQHYTHHHFKNKNLVISNHTLEQYLPPNLVGAAASADYVSDDYASVGIEVVLETLFDDSRLHLTEKTLRPIACGKPFILAATPGSLQYLRDYGFETFLGLIDESYDAVLNSRDRLDAIVQEMKRIAALAPDAKQVLYTKLHEIAQRNKQRFFNGLFDQVIEEYKTNLNQAMVIMQQHCTGRHRTAIRQLLQQN
jgi:hypothetical protein